MNMDEFRYRINKLSCEIYLHGNRIEIYTFSKCHKDLLMFNCIYNIIENKKTHIGLFYDLRDIIVSGIYINEIKFNLN